MTISSGQYMTISSGQASVWETTRNQNKHWATATWWNPGMRRHEFILCLRSETAKLIEVWSWDSNGCEVLSPFAATLAEVDSGGRTEHRPVQRGRDNGRCSLFFLGGKDWLRWQRLRIITPISCSRQWHGDLSPYETVPYPTWWHVPAGAGRRGSVSARRIGVWRSFDAQVGEEKFW